MLRSVRVFALLAASAAIALAAAPSALADECNNAVLDYNAILSRLTDARDAYSTCIADSKGTDDCSRAFRKLQLMQDQFAAAVAMYIKSCL